MKKISVLVVMVSLGLYLPVASSLGDFFSGNDKKKLLLTEQESKEKDLSHIIEEKEQFEQQREDTLVGLKQEIQVTESKIKQVQDEVKKEGDSEFLAKKLALLNELYHVLKKIQALLIQLPTLMNERIELLQTYVKDPSLDDFRESLVRDKCIYSFLYLKKLHQLIVDKKKTVVALEEQEEIAKTDLDNRKRALNATVKEYKKIKDEREQYKNKSESEAFSSEQQVELQMLEDSLFEHKKRLDELRVQESQQLVEVNKTKKFINKLQLGVLETTLRTVKPQVRVGEAEVSYAKDDLEEVRQKSYSAKREYDQEIDSLDSELKKKQKELQTLSEQVDLKLGVELDEWSKEPQKTAESHETLCKIGLLNSQILLIERKKDGLTMHLASEDENVRAKDINVRVQETFHKIQAGKFATDELLNQEIKKYNQLTASIKAALSFYQGQTAIADTLLKTQKKALSNIADRKQQLIEQENTVFRAMPARYRTCTRALQEAGTLSDQEVELIRQLKSGYADIITKLDDTLKLIEFISTELGQITIWHRPEHAVSWDGIKNTFSDIRAFFADLNTSVTQIDLQSVTTYFKDNFSSFSSLLLFIVQLLILVILLFVLRRYLPVLETSLLSFGQDHAAGRLVSFLLAAFVGCVKNSFFLFALGILALFFVQFYLPVDTQLYIFLYLLAIPYLIYLSKRSIRYLVRFNEEHEYCFLGKDFQSRFVVVFSTLVYATIVIWFFREAVILGNYSRTELPTILLAINFIILQISLISLISKEQILNLIPKGSDFWDTINSIVDRYYYLIFLVVIATIIMSNPYVGFGRLVLYILRRVLYTLGLLAIIIWAHQVVRRLISHMFFSTDNEVTKERFPYAKTWYGAAVIILFAVFTFLGAILIAKIWSWPEWFANISSWSDFEQILKTPLGEYNEISVWTLLTIVFYALGGILVSYAFSKFVLRRIFDILLVDAGVQNTIASMAHYIIFLTALILGFNAVGLGTLVGWLVGALAVSIGFVIKDPIGDFVAYFVILVQRPIKVGDYIELDETTGGVVRKITPRSVVVRRKNSTTIIVPNSEIIRKSIVNWNYTRGFIAFNDIKVTVSYTSDSVRARELMHKVLSENQSILKNPRPIVRLDDFSPDGYEFTVRGYLSSSYTLDQWDIASDVRMGINKEFTEHDIELAIPIRFIITQPEADLDEGVDFEVEEE